jgi:hypothetical protein
MKRILVGVFLCFMIVPKHSNGGFFSFVHDAIYGKEKAARTVASQQKIDPDLVSPDPSNYSTTRQAIYTAAHLALTGFVAWGFGDFVSYGMGTGAGVIAGLVAGVALAGNDIMPASLLTRLTNKKLPLSDRTTEGVLTAIGTAVNIKWLPGQMAMWSAQRADDFCLKTNTGRYAHAMIVGVFLAVNVAHNAAKQVMGHSKKGTTMGEKMWILSENIVALVPYLTAPLLFIYAKRGGDSFFGPECLEDERDSNPSIRTDPLGVMHKFEDTFPFALWSGGAAAMMVPIWLGKGARNTVKMLRYAIGNQDVVVGTGLALSAMTTSFFAASLIDHMWKYAFPQISGGNFPAEGAATILGLTLAQATGTAPNLSPSLPYNLTVHVFQQVQAFSAMQPIGLTPVLPTVSEIAAGAIPSTVGTPSSDLKGTVGMIMYPVAILSASFFAEGFANIARALGWKTKKLNQYFGQRKIESMRPLMALGDLNTLDGVVMAIQDNEAGAMTENPIRKIDGERQ